MTALTSINGWPVITSQGSPQLKVGVAPGTSIKLRTRAEALPLFLAIAADYHREVAPLRAGECGGYSYRVARQGGGAYSDHASGTAVDLNWGHEGAMGARGGMATMTAKQVKACAAIKARYKIIIWGGDAARGGDYHNPSSWDPMHFALKPGTTVASVEQLLNELGIKPDGTRGDTPASKPTLLTRVLRRPARPTH